MKTAISIPDDIYQAADHLAKRLGMSRSEFYSKAVSNYIASHLNDAVTEALNQIYEKETPDIDPVLNLMQLKSLPKEQW
ncbi:MAG: ribbon-helix-helix protein, CopG family [Desulfobacterales bacterium]|nr:MAG: ribbon-helix-helix protein, CopG family [Desulfobacterales bacterium]